MELEGKKRLLVTGQSRRTWSVGLCLAVWTVYWGRFGPKKAVLGHKMRSFGRTPPDVAPAPRAATGEFLAQNLDLARPPPMLQDGYMGKRFEALGRSNGQDGMETCLLLLVVACCLLTKFKGRGV